MKNYLPVLAVTLVLAAPAIAHAQSWQPTRPVRLIAPFPPGGAVDVIARIVASRLPERLGQQVVVDNRGGANAIIGTEIAVRAAPDGHTILIVPIGHSITPSVTKKLPYDTLKDLAPIGLIGNGAYVLVVNPSVPAKSVSEFIAHAKARAGGLNYAFTGHGNATHLAAELFKVLAGIDMQGINYKGGGPALTDLIGGQISVFFSGVASGAAQIKGGKIRALGVTTSRRSGGLPDVPTIAEAGVPGYEMVAWFGIAGPKGMASDLQMRLHGDLLRVLKNAEFQKTLRVAGHEIAFQDPPEKFYDFMKVEAAKWARVVQDSGARVE